MGATNQCALGRNVHWDLPLPIWVVHYSDNMTELQLYLQHDISVLSNILNIIP